MADLAQSTTWSSNGVGELDLGFGTGGTGFDGNNDGNGIWDANTSGLDLFDGFYFGNSGNGF